MEQVNLSALLANEIIIKLLSVLSVNKIIIEQEVLVEVVKMDVKIVNQIFVAKNVRIITL